jgi:glycosyltransferase involved in cell wall biosynthesis
MSKTHFKIVIPLYNTEKWIANCIKSVQLQDYKDFDCIIVDDMSTDNTTTIIKQLISEDPRFTLIENDEKKFALRNIYEAVAHTKPSPEDVIVTLDGDDWFATKKVLSKLDKIYTEEDCLLTYGSFIQYPSNIVGSESSKYPDEVVSQNTFRKDQWRASHLRTFKYSLWSRVKVEDLQDSEGNFYEMTYDQAMMLPMLEMCGNRSRYVKDILYVYNLDNPNAVNKTRAQKQYELMLEIRSKQPYEKIEL